MTTQPPFEERLKSAALTYPNHKFVQSIAGQCASGRTLSAAQFKAISEALDRLESEHFLLIDAPPLTSGKQAFSGTIIKLKEVDGKFGKRIKMIVRLDDQNKVWSTVPKGLDPKVNLQVKFEGVLEVSESDPHFGFVKFPAVIKPNLNLTLPLN
jgi:hypothetical protein